MTIPFDFSALEPRHNTYIYPGWAARFLSGDRQCQFSLYAQANYKIPKQNSDFDLEAYKIEHRALVDKTAVHLKSMGYQVYTEESNSFWVDIGNGKAVISAQPDLVAIDGSQVLVVECKTGKPRASDIAQNMIYTVLIPSVELHGITAIAEGQVVYSNYPDQEISPEKVDEGFKERMRQLVKMLIGREIPAATPSFNECQWCPIAHICDCKIDEQPNGSVDWL